MMGWSPTLLIAGSIYDHGVMAMIMEF
jgi:hypothetical protein